MNTNTMILIANFIPFLILVLFIIRVRKKEKKLILAMDHYNLENQTDLAKQEYVSDDVHFRAEYTKKVELMKLLKGPRKDYYKKYYSQEVAKAVGLELMHKNAISLDFIEGVETDIIEARIKYFVKV